MERTVEGREDRSRFLEISMKESDEEKARSIGI
jgi:hypothetical protein